MAPSTTAELRSVLAISKITSGSSSSIRDPHPQRHPYGIDFLAAVQQSSRPVPEPIFQDVTFLTDPELFDVYRYHALCEYVQVCTPLIMPRFRTDGGLATRGVGV